MTFPLPETSPCDVKALERDAVVSTSPTQYTYVDGDAPTITSVSPTQGGTGGGTTVTITGTGLT